MIGYLKGRVVHLCADYCLLDVRGVGYRVFVASSARSRLHKGEEAELFIHTSVREDAILLYGFCSQEEYDAFQLLISVSGIGPKVALGVLSAITVEGLYRAIHQKQSAVLTKLPGIGKKSADRMILELKDKVAWDESVEEGDSLPDGAEAAEDDMISEATAALVSLGYSQQEIAPAIKKAKACKSVQDIIRTALKELNRLRSV